MTKEIEEVGKWVDIVTEFGVKYGFQILGALVFLLVGLKVAAWVGRKVSVIAEARNIDTTLSRFFGSLVKLLVIAILVVITLGNFGISIAPLIALAGAGAFGATLAMQGPLSIMARGSRSFSQGRLASAALLP
jgi:small conductance mechanosensitive channel